MEKVALGFALCLGFLLGGCGMVAPKYQPSVQNIDRLKTSNLKPAAIGTVLADPALGSNDKSITLRANSMESPDSTYSAYLENALKTEFQAAGLLDPASSTRITGDLIKNDVSVGGFSTGNAEIEAKIQVFHINDLVYDKVKHVSIEFESSFFGAVAIPKGRDMYPVVVKKFIGELLDDPDFLKALQ